MFLEASPQPCLGVPYGGQHLVAVRQLGVEALGEDELFDGGMVLFARPSTTVTTMFHTAQLRTVNHPIQSFNPIQI